MFHYRVDFTYSDSDQEFPQFIVVHAENKKMARQKALTTAEDINIISIKKLPY